MKPRKITIDDLEPLIFLAVKEDREITKGVKNKRRKASVPSHFAMEFDAASLLSAMQNSGVSLKWLIKKYKGIADEPEETGATRLAALKELRRFQAIGAMLHPKIRKYLNTDDQTEEVSTKTSQHNPFSQLDAGNPNLKVAANG